MSVFSFKQRNNITLIIILLLGCVLIYSLQSILGALLSTLVLFTLLRPPFIYFTEKLNLNTRFIAVLLLFLSFLVIVLPFYALSNMVINKIGELRNDEIYFKNILFKLKEMFPGKGNIQLYLEDGLNKIGDYATGLFPSLLSGAVDIVLGLLIVYFLSYFMLVQRVDFEKALIKYSPFRPQNALKFAVELENITFANVVGQGLIAIVQGGLLSLAYFVLDYNDPIFWGVVAMFISFVPILGPPIIFVPAAFLKIIDGYSFEGWAMLLFGFIVIINIDNVLRFIIAKRIGNIHPIITVLGVIIGLPLFGIMGLVFGPLLISYFILLVKIYETSTLASGRLEKMKTITDNERFKT